MRSLVRCHLRKQCAQTLAKRAQAMVHIGSGNPRRSDESVGELGCAHKCVATRQVPSSSVKFRASRSCAAPSWLTQPLFEMFAARAKHISSKSAQWPGMYGTRRRQESRSQKARVPSRSVAELRRMRLSPSSSVKFRQVAECVSLRSLLKAVWPVHWRVVPGVM